VQEETMKLSPPARAVLRHKRPTTSIESVWYSSRRFVW
jgi:hypothetical protein